MAGNKVNAKAKGKDDRGKGSSKSAITNNDDTEDTDFSLLRKPIQTSITGFAQARKIFDMATEELRGLLSDECDLLYECKVCRNLFRSLANFISHKRVYCQNKFNSTVHGHFIKSSTTLNELTRIKRIEEGYQDSLKEVIPLGTADDDRIPLTKDLTTIIEKIATNKGICTQTTEYEPQVSLQKIPNSSIAVFQNLDTKMEKDNMITQVNELDEILSRNIAVLQNDGKFKIESSVADVSMEPQTGSIIQISDDEDGSGDSLKCKQCDMQFSTQKTLKFHMKYKHVDTRVVYPCPDCLEIFSTSWSVYRHLFKVHRKSAAQIRRLRESIQAKAFKMNNPPAFYEKRKNNMKIAIAPKITEEERLDQENQAWMDNMECDGEVPRCGGCGRSFERRAALAAHTHTCQPRSRALRRPETKRIEIQIRKDYNKGSPSNLVMPPVIDNNENKILREIKEKEKDKEKEKREDEIKPSRKDQEAEEIPERIAADEEGSRDSGMQLGDEETVSKNNSPAESPEKVEDTPKPEPQAVKPVRLPFAQHAEKSNLMALRQRVLPDIDLDRMCCKRCDTHCPHIQTLYDHVAKHYNWMRYACKLCNFKHYNFEKLPEHVKVVHKLKGDKDFYFSTVKALDGPEATGLVTLDDTAEADEASPDSRRPSRCSSDSSRLSDDSSSSCSRIEGSRKRKMTHKVLSKGIGKRRKSVRGKEEDGDWADKDDTPANAKTFEENSSDIDDTYDKIAKKRIDEFSTVASRRPVRRKAKPKNEDFEYDLSNLLKMEAQGYRESQNVNTTNPKSSQTKKKPPPEPLSNYEMLNKESCGALESLSRKAVENAKAHMKTLASLYIQRERVPSSIFVRPMLPKGLNRGDKLSPKKDNIEEKKESSVSNKETTKDNSTINLGSPDKSGKTTENDTSIVCQEPVSTDLTKPIGSKVVLSDVVVTSSTALEQNKDQNDSTTAIAKVIPKSISNLPVLPLKFRRQSIDVIKNNPVINKNIKDFTKAGMKTKILLIKPINRNKDGLQQAVNTPLKFQRIKLKDPNKSTLSDDKSSDQVVVVKVPKVDCVTVIPESPGTKAPCDTASAIKRTERTLSATDELPADNESIPESRNDNISSNIQKNGDVVCTNPKTSEIETTDEGKSKLDSIEPPPVINRDSPKNLDSNEEINYLEMSSDLSAADKTCESMDE